MQNRNLNKQQFFHGTTSKLKKGDFIEPRSGGLSADADSSVLYSYFSSNAEEARSWGKVIRPKIKDYVYRVQPTGAYEADPDSDATVNSRSTSPLRVIGKHPYREPGY